MERWSVKGETRRVVEWDGNVVVGYGVVEDEMVTCLLSRGNSANAT